MKTPAQILRAAGYSLSLSRERMSNGLLFDAPITRSARAIREAGEPTLVAALEAYLAGERDRLEAESKALFADFTPRINRDVFNRAREKRKALAEIRRVTDRLATFRNLAA